MTNPSMIAMSDEEAGLVYDSPRTGDLIVGGADMNKHFFYLAGPMSNRPAFNFPAFHAAAGTLRKQDYNICNPAELDSEIERRWAEASPDGAHDKALYIECLRRDLRIILNHNCVGIICLSDWFESFGARAVEVYNAKWLGLPFYDYNEQDDGSVVLTWMDPVQVLAHQNLDWI